MIWILVVCVIGIIVAVAAAVLFLPVSISAWVEHIQDTTNYRIAIRWPFSLSGVGIYGGVAGRSLQLLFGEKILYKWKRKNSKHKENRSDFKKIKSEKRRKKTAKEKFSGIQTFWENRELASEVLCPFVRFLRQIIRCIKRFRLSGDVEVGFSDPALMGFLYGIFSATVGYSRFFDELKITPNYVDTVYQGWLQFSVILTLSRISWAMLELIITLPKRKLWKLIKSRRKRNKKAKEHSIAD